MMVSMTKKTVFFKLPWPSLREQPDLHAFVRVIAEVCIMVFGYHHYCLAGQGSLIFQTKWNATAVSKTGENLVYKQGFFFF